MSINLSILIPVYNVLPYLDACIESVLPAMRDGDEIILVDDGSTDGSGELCDGWQSRQPKLIRAVHQQNGGLSAARNRAFLESSNPYVYFLDSDDLLCADGFSAARQKLPAFEPDILTCNAQIWRDNDFKPNAHVIRHSLPEGACTSHEATLISTFRDDFLSSSCRIFKRKFLNQFSPNIFPIGQYYEDNSTIPRLIMKAACVCYSADTIFRYRIREGSITQTPSLQRCIDQGSSFKNVLTSLAELQIDNRVKRIANVLAFKHLVMATRNAAEIRPTAWRNIELVIERGIASLTITSDELIDALASNPENSKLLRHAKGMLHHRQPYIATRLIAAQFKHLRAKIRPSI